MKSIYALIFFLCYGGVLHAQVGIGTTTPNANAVLELKSPGNNQGFLTPRLTTAQRTAISLTAAENGLLVYDTDESKFYYWQVSQWLPLRSGNDVALAAGAGIDITDNTVSAIPDGDGDATNEIQDLQMVGNTLTITNNANATGVDLAPFAGTNTDNQTLNYNTTTAALSITGGNTVTVSPAGPAGGSLSGNYPNPGLADNAVTTAKINNLAVTTGKIANDAINSAKISDGTITSADLNTTGVTLGTYGNALSVPRFTVDAKGRVTFAENVTIEGTLPGGTAGGVLTGTYPNPGLANNAVTSTTIADGAVLTAKIANSAVTVGKISPSTTNGQVLTTVGGVAAWSTPAPAGTGTVTSITAGTGLTGGTINTSGTIALSNTLKNGGGSFGSATEIPTFTVDDQGRLTEVGSVTISGGGSQQGLDEVLAVRGDAKNQPAFNLSSVSIGDWSKAAGPGTLNVNGSHFVNFRIVPDGYVVQPDDYILIGDPGKEPTNIILPDAGPNKGRILIIRSVAQNSTQGVIVKGKETIDGSATSETLFIDSQLSNNTAYAITIMSTGTQWITISRSIGKNRG